MGNSCHLFLFAVCLSVEVVEHVEDQADVWYEEVYKDWGEAAVGLQSLSGVGYDDAKLNLECKKKISLKVRKQKEYIPFVAL